MTKEYSCKRCGYKSEFKSSLRNHLSRKNECKSNLQNISRNDLLQELNNKPEKVFNCNKCGKEYLLRQSKWKHEKTCNYKIEETNEDLKEQVINDNNLKIDNQQNETIEILNKKIEYLELKLKLKYKSNSNIRIFGKENYDYINDDTLFELKSSKLILYEFVKYVHFNKDHPENHNFYISNLRSNKVHIYREDRFIVEDKKTVLNELIIKIKDKLLGLLVCSFKLTSEEIRSLISTVEAFDTYICEPYSKRVTRMIEECAYNNRDLFT
jgi:predicted RNA-binding Zn-ribbon protein involved in translation (DUF1610 family)